MKTYEVTRLEEEYRAYIYTVEADNEDEAKDKVAKGECIEVYPDDHRQIIQGDNHQIIEVSEVKE